MPTENAEIEFKAFRNWEHKSPPEHPVACGAYAEVDFSVHALFACNSTGVDISMSDHSGLNAARTIPLHYWGDTVRTVV